MKGGEEKWDLVGRAQWAHFPPVARFQRQKNKVHNARLPRAVRLVRTQNRPRFDTGRAFADKSVNRGFRLPRLGHAGERKKQHPGLRRLSEGGSERVLSADGRLDQAARSRPERAKVPARGRSSESQAQPGRGSHGMANAGEHDNKHGKRGRVQQQAKTGSPRDEARGQQRVKHRHKKAALKLMEGGPSKINPPNSHPSNPVHRDVQKKMNPPTQQKIKPPVEDPPQHETAEPLAQQKMKPPSEDPPQHETNKRR